MRKEIQTARYYNANFFACAIVAVVNHVDNEIYDWAAYMGGCSHDLPEREAVETVAFNGSKISRKDAAYFFPHLPIEKYRE